MNMQLMESVLKLMQEGRTKKPSEFQVWCLHLVNELIEFDSSVWYEVSLSNNNTTNDIARIDYRIQSSCLFNQPDDLMKKYLPFMEQDLSVQIALQRLNKTLIDHKIIPREEYLKQSIFWEFYKPFNIEDSVFTAVSDDKTGLVNIISLFRADKDWLFNEQERLIKQNLVNYLMEARKVNLMCNSPIHKDGNLVAVCDSNGNFIHIEDGFLSLYKQEYHQEKSPYKLNDDIFARLKHREKLNLKNFWYYGKEIIFYIKNIDENFYCVQIWKNPKNRLSPTQHDIAYLYGVEGETYKQIARTLNMSLSAVKRHLEKIRERLGVSTKLEIGRIIRE